VRSAHRRLGQSRQAIVVILYHALLHRRFRVVLQRLERGVTLGVTRNGKPPPPAGEGTLLPLNDGAGVTTASIFELKILDMRSLVWG
jgi:hypothetical protein